MAAGLGTRMRPLTERYAKPVLPIDGRPVLGSLLRELAAARITDVTVVCGHLAEQVERFVGDGAAWSLRARFARQERPDGSTDAVLAAAAEPPYLVLGADTLFARGDVGRFVASFRDSGAVGAVAVRRTPGPSAHRHAVRVAAGGRVERMQDDDPGNPLSGAPLWAVAAPLARRLEARPGRPPWELQTAFQQAIDEGEHIAGIEIGTTRDLTAPADVLVENFPYLRAL